MSIDDLDKKILTRLNQNRTRSHVTLRPLFGELNVKELAKEVTDTLEDLEANGFIDSDLDMDGFDEPTISANLPPNSHKAGVDTMPANPEIKYRITMTGKKHLKEIEIEGEE